MVQNEHATVYFDLMDPIIIHLMNGFKCKWITYEDSLT